MTGHIHPDFSDEEIYEPSKEEADALLEQQASFDARARPYTLEFSEYKGLSLDKCVREKADLREALNKHYQTKKAKGQEASASTLDSGRKRRLSQTELQSSSLDAKKENLSVHRIPFSDNDQHIDKAMALFRALTALALENTMDVQLTRLHQHTFIGL
ncbi:MAG: hypothetical protein Q9191_004968 [Dirinaria sp. TL-2023a]